MEGGLDVGHRGGAVAALDRQLERLADVAHVERAPRSAIAASARSRPRRARAAPSASISAKIRRAVGRQRAPAATRARAHVVVPDVRDQQAERREVAGHRRHQHARACRSPRRSAAACIGPAPPKAKQREVARIVAALDRDLVDRGGHLRDRDAHDALGQRRPRPGRAAPASAPTAAARPRAVEADLAAERPRRCRGGRARRWRR